MKICHLESDSALEASDVHVAERATGREPGGAGQAGQLAVGGQVPSLLPSPGERAMGCWGWHVKPSLSIHKTSLSCYGTGHTKLLRPLKGGDEPKGRESEFGIRKACVRMWPWSRVGLSLWASYGTICAVSVDGTAYKQQNISAHGAQWDQSSRVVGQGHRPFAVSSHGGRSLVASTRAPPSPPKESTF